MFFALDLNIVLGKKTLKLNICLNLAKNILNFVKLCVRLK
jgi:hypothetical protein